MVVSILFFLLFYISAVLLLHSYIIYPVSIWILCKFINKQYYTSDNYQPTISILISVFNEEKVIENTIRILQNSIYPKEKIEILIGSDNSTDTTIDIVERLSEEFTNIKLYQYQQRRGKPHVINDIAKIANGEILIFCDANTSYDKEAINNLVRNYQDLRVGGVSGKLKLIDNEDSNSSASQEKKYWDAETWLKEQEGKLGILIGANGGIYSIKREYFNEIPTDRPVMDDFFISLKVLEKRKAFLYIKDAIAEEFTAPTITAEFNRKVRNNSIMMSTIKVIKKLLNPSFGLSAYGLWSHKIIRWFTPVILLILFASNYGLIDEGILYKYFFIVQCAFYLSALVGFILLKYNIKIEIILLCYYFVMTNIAMFIGLLKFIFNKHTSYWQSTPR